MKPIYMLSNIGKFIGFTNFTARLRYPYSMPVEIGEDLGLGEVSNDMSFDSFLDFLCSDHCYPQKIKKFMTREEMEEIFLNVFRFEHFTNKSRYSYYFKQGWVEFELFFDDQNRLRRMSVQNKNISKDTGVEIPIY